MNLKLAHFSFILWLLVISATTLSGSRSVLADSAQEYTLKAAITLNFARFTEWPSQALPAEKSTLQLCVVGDNIVQDAFQQMDQKKVANRTLDVIYLSRLRNLDECQLLFISGLDKNTTIQLLSELKQHPILTIGESNYFADYSGMVNLDMQEGKIEIEINLEATKKAGLNISSRVLNLATIVKSK